MALTLLTCTSLQAQELFNGFGKKGYYTKLARESEKVVIPQLSINFDTYVETKVVVSEGKLSKLQNTFDAASKGGNCGGEQRGSAKSGGKKAGASAPAFLQP